MEHAVQGIDHVQLAAPPGCEEQARRFYGEVLGMAEIPKPEALRARGGVWFRCGEHQLHIGVESPFLPARKAHPAIRVASVEALRARLQVFGIGFTGDDLLPGTARLYVNDPFGNRLEFLEPLATD